MYGDNGDTPYWGGITRGATRAPDNSRVRVAGGGGEGGGGLYQINKCVITERKVM